MATLRSVVKHAVFLLPPDVGLPVAESLRWLGSRRAREARRRTKALLGALGDTATVRSGIFVGMRYPLRFGAQGGLLPKILGTYESELAGALRAIVDARPPVVIDVGAAEGYYAVGLSRMLPDSIVEAYELETPYHSAIRRLARANGVEPRVRIRGACTPDTLSDSLARARGGAAIVCDCEGFEAELLDPARVSGLESAIILCEVHERIRPGVSAQLSRRFADTHQLTVIHTASRSPADLPSGVRFSADDCAFAMDEGRAGPMEWFLWWPR